MICYKGNGKMSEECIICGAPLEYLERDEMMECMLCHKKEEFGIEMEKPEIRCIHYDLNNQCIGSRCQFRK